MALRIYIEPRDLWVGAYVPADEDAVYICPLPMLVIKWTKVRQAKHER